MRHLLRRQRERDGSAQVVKQESGVKREHEHEHSRERSYTINGAILGADEVSFISAKKFRYFPVTLNEQSMEMIDLIKCQSSSTTTRWSDRSSSNLTLCCW
jgi:hypothetical protein